MPSKSWCPSLRPGFVTGLRAEARIASTLGASEAGGGLPDGAVRVAENLVAQGVSALVSFGLCGGLHPALRPGALVVPRTVLWHGACHATDASLSAALGGCSADTLLAGDVVVADPVAKSSLFTNTGAVAIDLESGVVAGIAQRAAIPFAVLRAVCDPADVRLPSAALVALDAGGAVSGLAVAGSLLRNPRQIFALIALGRAANAARRALVGRVHDIGVGRFLVR